MDNAKEEKKELNPKANEPVCLLKAGEVAKILNISRAFAYQLMRQDLIPTVKILGARRVRPEDLDRFIRERIAS
jgi:excisionase family DNA binding protein